MKDKTKSEKVRVTFYISKEIADKIDETIAKHMLEKKEKISKSELVEKALRSYLLVKD